MNQDMTFDGADVVPARDNARLTSQYQRIFDLMNDQQERTLGEIGRIVGAPEASVSAQLRHMRKARNGAHRIERRYVGGGVYTYKLAYFGEQP